MSDKDSIQKLVDEVFDNIDSLIKPEDDPKNKKIIGMWLPDNYKDRYDILQAKTNNRFGKKLQEIVMQAIDRVDGKI